MLAPCKEGIPETVLKHGIPSARPLDESAPKRLGNGDPRELFSAVVIGEVERRRLADTGGLRLPSSLCTTMLHGVPVAVPPGPGRGGTAYYCPSALCGPGGPPGTAHPLAAKHFNSCLQVSVSRRKKKETTPESTDASPSQSATLYFQIRAAPRDGRP